MTTFVPAFNSTNNTISIAINTTELHPEQIHNNHTIDDYEMLVVVRKLIELRVKHCESELIKATLENKVLGKFQDSFIFEQGHFNIHVYDTMVKFLNGFEIICDDLNKYRPIFQLIFQQALRQYLLIMRTEPDTIFSILKHIPQDKFETFITEPMF